MAVIIPKEGIQYTSLSQGTFTFADETPAGEKFVDAGTYNFVLAKLPPGATVVGGQIMVTTAFDGRVTVTLDIGDNDPSGGDPQRYIAAGDLTALGRTPATLPTFKTTQQCDLVGAFVASGGTAPTAGEVSWSVQYVVDNRVHENWG